MNQIGGTKGKPALRLEWRGKERGERRGNERVTKSRPRYEGGCNALERRRSLGKTINKNDVEETEKGGGRYYGKISGNSSKKKEKRQEVEGYGRPPGRKNSNNSLARGR